MTNAVLAVGNARLFLEQDNYDIRCEPEFEKASQRAQLALCTVLQCTRGMQLCRDAAAVATLQQAAVTLS